MGIINYIYCKGCNEGGYHAETCTYYPKESGGKEMSVITYTDGSKTIWGVCTCGLTNCKCGAVKHYPHKADIELAEMGMEDLKKTGVRGQAG